MLLFSLQEVGGSPATEEGREAQIVGILLIVWKTVDWSSPGFVDSYGLADSSGSRVLLS